MDAKDGQFESTFKIIQQAIGRHARLTQLEKENPNVLSKRVVLLTKSKTYPGLLQQIIKESVNSYKNVKVYSLENFESLLISFSRSSKSLGNFNKLPKILRDNFKNVFSICEIETIDDTRLLLLKGLVDYLKTNESTFDLNIYLKTVYKFIALIYFSELLIKLTAPCLELSNNKKLCFDTLTFYFKNYAINKKEPIIATILTTYKHETKNFLQYVKKNNKLPFEVPFEQCDENQMLDLLISYFKDQTFVKILIQQISS